MVAAIAAPSRVLEIAQSQSGAANVQPTTLVTPSRNADYVDNGRGVGTGGVSAGRIGFTKSPTANELRESDKTMNRDLGLDPTVAAYSVLGAPATGLVGAAAPVVGYGPDGKPPVGATFGSDGVRGVGRAAQPTESVQAATVARQTQQAQPVEVAASNQTATAKPSRAVAESPADATTDTRPLARTTESAQPQTQREATAARQAERLGEAQNVEPTPPQAKESDLARQRMALAYQPEAAAATKLNLFA